MKRPSLAALYTTLNAQLWNGQLPPTVPRGRYCTDGTNRRSVAVFRVGARRDVGGKVTGWLRSGRGCGGCLGLFRPAGQFAPAHINVLSPLGAAFEREVLLHEMAHYALWLAGVTDRPWHGARFVAELDRLAAHGEAWATAQAATYRAAIEKGGA